MGLWPAKKEETTDQDVIAARAILGAIPEHLKGKTPEEIAAALNESTTLRASETALKTERDALKAERDAQKAEVERLKAAAPKTASSETPAEGEEELSPAAKKLLEKELKPMRDGLTAQAAQMAESNFRMSHANDPVFTKFQGEFNELLGKQSLDARANPVLIQNCWNLVRANHIEDVYKQEIAGRSTNDGIGHGGGRPPGNTTTTAKPEDSLTPVELAQAKRMHITPTQYAESKSKLTIVNG